MGSFDCNQSINLHEVYLIYLEVYQLNVEKTDIPSTIYYYMLYSNSRAILVVVSCVPNQS